MMMLSNNILLYCQLSIKRKDKKWDLMKNNLLLLKIKKVKKSIKKFMKIQKFNTINYLKIQIVMLNMKVFY